MVRSRHTPRALALLAIAGTAACGDDPVGPLTRIQILGTTGGSDTVLAMAAQPMVVQVSDNLGRPRPGVEVRIQAVPPPTDPMTPALGMYVCRTSRRPCATYVNEQNFSIVAGMLDTTDSEGLVSANVQFGVVAGPTFVEVTIPELDVVRQVPFTTLPGALARVVAAADDTSIYVGSSYDLQARATDRFGNPRTEPVTAMSLTPAVASVVSGRLTAQSLGRGRILLQSGAVTDTAFVSVPPRGRLVTFGWTADRVSLRLLTLINTDGTGRRVVLNTPGYSANTYPVWTPDGRILFAEETTDRPRLQLTDTLGNRITFLQDFEQSIQAATSSDSVYFYGTQRFTGVTGIYRASFDGSGATFLFPGSQPAPAPDGSRVAYSTGDSMMVRDMATGATTRLVPGPPLAPRWSPSSDLIAFVLSNGDLEAHVVRSDASGLRVIAPGFRGAVSWSPDGEWLATSMWEGGIELIRLADGERLPISGTDDLFQASWRP